MTIPSRGPILLSCNKTLALEKTGNVKPSLHDVKENFSFRHRQRQERTPTTVNEPILKEITQIEEITFRYSKILKILY